MWIYAHPEHGQLKDCHMARDTAESTFMLAAPLTACLTRLHSTSVKKCIPR